MDSAHLAAPSEDGGAPAAEQAVLVAISGSSGSETLVRAAARLAEWLDAPWQAVHVETPDADRASARFINAAEALALAARLGATIATIPAASAADGIEAHLGSSPATHLVLGGRGRPPATRFWQKSILDRLAERGHGLVLHVFTRDDDAEPASTPRPVATMATPPRSYLFAAGFVGATLLLAEALQLVFGTRPLDLLFLFPVVAVSARFGLRPALLAIVLSVVCYNYFLLLPYYSFNPAAPQNLIMTGVLIAIAVYTSLLTSRLRGRLVLSDRSARENASLAALAQKLTRDSDWETTALTICEHVQNLLKVEVAVFREVDGSLSLAASSPPGITLGPVDSAALNWVWAHGEEAGAGTATLGSADWQFQPLETSLGMLAVIGLAREDGGDPVRADQRILLQTLVAQSALAHERLRLEDSHRPGARL